MEPSTESNHRWRNLNQEVEYKSVVAPRPEKIIGSRCSDGGSRVKKWRSTNDRPQHRERETRFLNEKMGEAGRRGAHKGPKGVVIFFGRDIDD